MFQSFLPLTALVRKLSYRVTFLNLILKFTLRKELNRHISWENPETFLKFWEGYLPETSQDPKVCQRNGINFPDANSISIENQKYKIQIVPIVSSPLSIWSFPVLIPTFFYDDLKFWECPEGGEGNNRTLAEGRRSKEEGRRGKVEGGRSKVEAIKAMVWAINNLN